jgi:catechol 2,3-dioxygenase-like lactoylglutathione lyase family enzyme
LPAYANVERHSALMPNIENLKKQAKLYLRWHRDGYYPVAAQIRSHLARFHDVPDKDILDAPFKLGDAQELIARKHGFENWPALIKGFASMTASAAANASNAIITAAEPQLFVADMDVACRFYEKLGFKVAFVHGEPPFYAQIVRDGARVNLRKVEGPVFDAGLRAREGDILAATLTLDDAKPLFLEFQNAGVAFHQTLRTEPWGARTFIVKDPDGNLICFAGSA